MPAPTFIQEAETAFNSATSPKTTASFAVQVGDVLVAYAIGEDSTEVFGTPTNTGTALTWTLAQSITVASGTEVSVWTTTATVTQSITVSLTQSTAGLDWGFNVLTFRGSAGVGASAKTNASGAPTLNLLTTQANSAIVVANGDWAAIDGASRTWRNNAGTLTEQTYYRQSGRYTAYGGYHADAGAVATYAVGLSAPAGQTYAIIAVEVKGTASAGLAPRSLIVMQAVNRSARY